MLVVEKEGEERKEIEREREVGGGEREREKKRKTSVGRVRSWALRGGREARPGHEGSPCSRGKPRLGRKAPGSSAQQPLPRCPGVGPSLTACPAPQRALHTPHRQLQHLGVLQLGLHLESPASVSETGTPRAPPRRAAPTHPGPGPAHLAGQQQPQLPQSLVDARAPPPLHQGLPGLGRRAGPQSPRPGPARPRQTRPVPRDPAPTFRSPRAAAWSPPSPPGPMTRALEQRNSPESPDPPRLPPPDAPASF